MEETSLKTKICLVGDKGVGKTSLIRRCVLDVFEDRYVATLGTKVSKKALEVAFPAEGVTAKADVLIWDIMGEHAFQALLKDCYFYGARGILAVVDVTRRSTLAGLDAWVHSMESVTGPLPMVVAVNKADLMTHAEFGVPELTEQCHTLGCDYVWTSARTGENVEAAFERLGELVVRRQLFGTWAGAESPG